MTALPSGHASSACTGNERLVIHSQAKGVSRAASNRGVELAADRCMSRERTKTVSSRDDINVEIISPFAFTFKIPFH